MSYDFSKVNILVVESTSEMFKLFKMVFSALNVPVQNIHAVYSAEEGFNKFVASNHDLIITDWMENPDTGIRLVRKIRMDKKSPNQYVPIIMSAGSGHESRVIRSRDAGVSEYLVKPFSAGALAMRITRVVERPRPFVVSTNYIGPDRRVKDVDFEGEDRRVETQEVVVER